MPVSSKVKQAAIVEYVRGKSMRDVAKAFGVSHQAVHQWLEMYGIRRRTRSREIAIPKRRKTTQDRFWEKVNKVSGKYSRHVDGQCWEWTAGLISTGYGGFWGDGKREYAHRYSWRIHNKKQIKGGMVIMHLCDNPLCVRPSHLRMGTHMDNITDAIKKGRRK